MTVAFTDLEDLFCILHDGRIAHAWWDGPDLLLDVRIKYLAQRVSPGLGGFAVRLHAVDQLVFNTWPAAGSEPDRLVNADAIFKADLEVLSGSVIGDKLCIVCGQCSPAHAYSGGELTLRVASAAVSDEAGKDYSIEELRELCRGYWDDWSKRNEHNLS